MSLQRWISAHRATVTLTVLVVLSLTSLASGARGGVVKRGLHVVVSVTSHPFLKGLRGIRDGVGYVSGLVISYDKAREEAETLRKRCGELMQLAGHRRELEAENQRLRRQLQFVRNYPRLTLETVDIIEVDVIEKFKGILRIDRGSMHGIEPSMCAVTEDGVVGLVTDVELTTSTVVTPHNVNCRIGAMIKRNRVRGMVHGGGGDLSSLCTMEYIDLKDDVCEGDEVVTSPESVFPAGYPVGRVMAVHDEGGLWKAADVVPDVDPLSVDEVFLVRNATPSWDEMAGVAPDAQGKPAPTATMLDNRTIQERYAP